MIFFFMDSLFVYIWVWFGLVEFSMHVQTWIWNGLNDVEMVLFNCSVLFDHGALEIYHMVL
jgi:hypothetical protein